MMRRATLFAWVVGLAAADTADDCMAGLELLAGESEVVVAARCRAAFGPEVCKQATRSLGAKPWTQERMLSSCSHFASTSGGLDARALEEAVSNKPASRPASVDGAVRGKGKPAAPVGDKTKGPVAALLSKLQAADKTTSRKEASEVKKRAPAKAKQRALELNEQSWGLPMDEIKMKQDARAPHATSLYGEFELHQPAGPERRSPLLFCAAALGLGSFALVALLTAISRRRRAAFHSEAFELCEQQLYPEAEVE